MLKWKLTVEEPLLLIHDVSNDIEELHLRHGHYYHLVVNVKISAHRRPERPHLFLP